jgi:UTP-glucose-1-phosphate uridylyltransferase
VIGEKGVGQIMVESFESNVVENYGIAELKRELAVPCESLYVKGLVDMPYGKDVLSNLAFGARGDAIKLVIKELFKPNDW